MSSTATKNVTPDPKPSAKRQSAADRKAIALRDGKDAQKKLDAEQAALDASPSIEGPSEADVDEACEQLTEELGGTSAAKAKVREASKATLARRAKNAADKAKTSERKAEERAERAQASATFKAQVIVAYKKTPDVAKVAAKFTNERTGLPYSQMRIRRILNEAGVLVTTKRGDTSERDARIVQQIESGMEVAAVATEHDLSAARVRGIAKKAGLVLGGGRSGKLPKVGTPEWNAFSADVAELCEKYGVALGTMAHALRKA